MNRSRLDELTEAALGAVDSERLVETLRLLIETPSPTGSERRCAEVLAERLAADGVAVQVDAFEPDRANAVGSVGGPGPLRLLFCGHLDTTGYGDDRDRPWLYEPGPGDRPRALVENGIVSGLGAYNMKGGLAAAAEALVALRTIADELEVRVGLAAVAGESEKAPVDGLLAHFHGPAFVGGGVGAERLVETGLRPDGVVICEPSGLAVVNAQPGYVLLRILVRGSAGYLPEPDRPTVVQAVAAIVDAIRSWSLDYHERAALDCGLGTIRPTCTVGAIEAGAPYKPGGPPAAGALYVDLRVPPGLPAEDVVDDLAGAIRRAAGEIGPFRIEPSVYADNTPGAITPPDHPLVELARAARDRVAPWASGAAPDADFVPGDDGKVFARVGIPYVKVGPGSVAGRDPRYGREQVPISQLEAAARTYVVLGALAAAAPVGSWRPIPRLPR